MTPTTAGTTVLVVGLGNPLMADDGFGEAVVDALRRHGLPPGMTAKTAPDVLGLWSLWRGQEEVWLVDAVAAGGCAGAIHRFAHDEIFVLSSGAGSAHHLSLVSNLRWLLHANEELQTVRFRMWGVEPATVSARPCLSAPVAAVVAPVAREIRAQANRQTTNHGWLPHREVS